MRAILRVFVVNAKTQRRKDAKEDNFLEAAHVVFENAYGYILFLANTCANQAKEYWYLIECFDLVNFTSQHFPLCAFASLRLCVKYPKFKHFQLGISLTSKPHSALISDLLPIRVYSRDSRAKKLPLRTSDFGFYCPNLC